MTQPLRGNRQVQAGLIVAATLLGWAAVRRKKPAAARGRLMSSRRPEINDNLLLIAATTILVLTVQRYFQTDVVATASSREPDLRLPNQPMTSLDVLSAEISQPEHGRLSHHPLQIPMAGLEGHSVANLCANRRGPLARDRRRRGVFRPAGGVSGDHRVGLMLWPVRQPRRPSAPTCRRSP